MMMLKIVLKEGRDKAVLRGHPWVFADAISQMVEATPGEVVEVWSHRDILLGMAFYNTHSSISLRMLSRQKGEITGAWIREKLKSSIARRQGWASDEHQVQRWVAFEGDHLPGLIVDRYGDYLIFQILSAGMEHFRDDVIEVLKSHQPKGIIERSDEKIREKEGLTERKELVFGELPPQGWQVKEHGLKYSVDLWEGHKTGFYIDQSSNRRKLASLPQNDGKVLNCFCYTGGFTLSVLKGGAKKVISVDSSLPALQKCEQNLTLNGYDADEHECIQGDVFDVLKDLQGKETFDGIILDPPKFASRKQHLKNALKAYRELNVLGMKLLKPGGWLATFTCSGRVTRDEFQTAIEEASAKVGQTYVVEDWLSQCADHSVRVGFAESLYLKGLLLRRVD
jgi:23S rRNA (cytosine1962-C5)-methyltransferase